MQERDFNLNHIQSTSSSTVAAIFSSPFHIENNLQNNNKQQRTQQVPTMNISGTSSNYTINTTTTIDTTDSGISTDGMMSKKRHKFWNLLGGGKNKGTSVSKQKSATLGREKDRKKDKRDLGRDSEEKHRWSTGFPKLSPLPANISKEKLCQLLDTKLNDSQLFFEFERIPKRKENAEYTCALMEENYSKNSDPTCLPMDENRVKLIPTRDNRIGYVNASYVSVSLVLFARLLTSFSQL